MPSKSVFFVLILASSVMRIFAAGVWGYAKPDSDALVYFNAGQAEKSMEKGLWKKISRIWLTPYCEKGRSIMIFTQVK